MGGLPAGPRLVEILVKGTRVGPHTQVLLATNEAAKTVTPDLIKYKLGQHFNRFSPGTVSLITRLLLLSLPPKLLHVLTLYALSTVWFAALRAMATSQLLP